MNQIWQAHFADVPQKNNVKIKFGRNARTRLGSIKQPCNYRSIPPWRERTIKNFRAGSKNIGDTLVTLSGYFKEENVPEFIIDLTIAHELCHYAHGFSSPLPQLFQYPHQGGLVDKELIKRGFGPKLKEQKKWLKEVWPKIIGTKTRKLRRRRSRVVKYSNIFQILFS